MQSKPWPFQSRKKKTSEKLTGYSFDQCEGGSLKIYKYSCIVNSQEDTTYNIFLVNVTSYFKPFWLPDNKQPATDVFQRIEYHNYHPNLLQ